MKASKTTILVVLAMVVLVGITTLSQQKRTLRIAPTTTTTTAASMTADKAAAAASGLAATGDGVAAAAAAATVVATTVENITTTQQNQHCISTEEELLDMIASTNHVMIAMEAKAAGTSLKQFAKLCNKASGIPNYAQLGDNFVNSIPNNKKNIQQKVITNSYQPPNVVASHMYNPKTLSYLVRNVPPSTLLIYSHRQETSRMQSAIEHVMGRFCGPPKHRRPPKGLFFKPSKQQEQELPRNNNATTSSTYNNDNRNCHVKEEDLIKIIKKKLVEIKLNSYKLLNCNVYDNIVDYQHYPNTKMVFMNYKYADWLQTHVAQKYCPKYLSSDDDNESSSIATSIDSNSTTTTATTNNTSTTSTSSRKRLRRSLQEHANTASQKKSTVYVHTKNKVRKGNQADHNGGNTTTTTSTMNSNEVDHTDEDEEDMEMVVATLRDWLQTKSSTLEWSLHMNDVYFNNPTSKSCISTTRQLEEDLATCKYGMIRATVLRK